MLQQSEAYLVNIESSFDDNVNLNENVVKFLKNYIDICIEWGDKILRLIVIELLKSYRAASMLSISHSRLSCQSQLVYYER